MITNRSASNFECGPVCDLKSVAEVSKNGRCYPTTSIRSTKRVTTPRQDRYLVISARRQRGSTARALGSALTVATGIQISRQNVYRRLSHSGLYARRPSVCIPLTSAHKRARLNWSLKHQHWSVSQWDVQ
ncbi:transposable element Tcb2 transposase [Trichonephila clavipes]|nr:transposable element Tcb2 transposase [Trichonephila clavipes]